MADDDEPAVADNLYALIVYLHAESTDDLVLTLAGEEISPTQLRVLARLRTRRRRYSIREMSAVIHRTPTATSRLVDQLARRGLISREGDDDDFRKKRLEITERGDQVLARLHAARYDRIVAFTEDLEPGERAQLTSALQQLVARDEIRQFRPVPIPA